MDAVVRLLGAALLLGACGPPLVGVGETGESKTTGESATTGESTTTSESTTAGSESSEATSATEGLPFVPEPDSPASNECEFFYERACPEGEKCVPYHTPNGYWGEEFKCVPVSGDREPGESCMSTGILEATDDCDADSYCWNYDEDGVGTCYALCAGIPDDVECPPDTFCEWYIFVCVPICDPTIQDCGPGLGCYWDSNFQCMPALQSNTPTGEPCGYINDCAPGNMCVDATVMPDCLGSACCAAYCNVDLGDAQCEVLPETVCVPLFEEGMAPGYEHVGVCILPQ